MHYHCDAILNVGELDLSFVDEYEDVRLISLEACGRRAPEPDCVARRHIVIDSQGRRWWALSFFTRQPLQFRARSEQEVNCTVWRLQQLGWRVL